MIKALFFDIDGTLVSFKTHRIPESTIEALTKAKANGVKIFISTGRPRQLINNIRDIEYLVDGYITTNGAYCFIGDEVILCNPIDPKNVIEIVDRVNHINCAYVIMGDKLTGIINEDDKSRNFCKMLNTGELEKYPIDTLLNQKILQITPMIDTQQEKTVLHDIHGVESSRWYPDFADFTAKGTTKATGLSAITKALGCTLQETMAFGDGGNDATILKAAGIGVAMGNSGDALKEIADYVTTSVDDNGVYNALKAFKVIE